MSLVITNVVTYGSLMLAVGLDPYNPFVSASNNISNKIQRSKYKGEKRNKQPKTVYIKWCYIVTSFGHTMTFFKDVDPFSIPK